MRILKEIFGKIWAVWTILVFVGTMLLFLIPYYILVAGLKEPLRTHRFIAYSRVWMGVFLALIGCPVKRRGLHHFQKGQAYIVLCNHNSFMDVPVSSPSIPGGNKTIAKIEMASIPIFSSIYKSGSILVDRKSDASRKESYLKMKQVLQMGLHMCIYPEGTRNKTTEPLKSFHSGAFRLAKDTGAPIIPALIFNTKKVLPASKTMYVMPHPLQIHFLEPVFPSDYLSADDLKEKVHAIMSDYYSKTSALIN